MNKKGAGSEHHGQESLRKLMHSKGWLTEKMHGSAYQKDIPDLYCLHPTYGSRWIEMKRRGGRLSPGQIRKFCKWARYGGRVWILEGPQDYEKLFKRDNLSEFLMRSAR